MPALTPDVPPKPASYPGTSGLPAVWSQSPRPSLHKVKDTSGPPGLGVEDSLAGLPGWPIKALFMDDIRTPEEVLQIYDAITAEDVLAHGAENPSPQRL